MTGSSNETWKVIRDPKTTRLLLSNLFPGEYQVAFKASYEGEDFSEELISKVFRIKKPFYLRFWFIHFTIFFSKGLGILIDVFFRYLHKLGVLKTAFDTKEKEKIFAEQELKMFGIAQKKG